MPSSPSICVRLRAKASAAFARPSASSSSIRSSGIISISTGLVALPMLANAGAVGNRALAEHPPGDARGGQLIALAGYLSVKEAVKAARSTMDTLKQ